MSIIQKPFPRSRGKYREAGMGGAQQKKPVLLAAPPSDPHARPTSPVNGGGSRTL
mgnify:CR=1 FL=1